MTIVDDKDYVKLVPAISHLQSKTQNSIAELVAIRYLPEQKKTLPYLGVISILSGDTDLLDYSGNAHFCRVAKALLGIEEAEEVEKPEKKSTRERKNKTKQKLENSEVIYLPPSQEVLSLLAEEMAASADAVDCRVKQVVLPTSEGGYLSLSPLEGYGVSVHVAKIVAKFIERDVSVKAAKYEGKKISFDGLYPGKKVRKIKIPVGGKQPQNVSLRYGTAPHLMFDAPSEPAIIFSVLHKGISLSPSYDILSDFISSAAYKNLVANDESFESDLEVESGAKSYASWIIKSSENVSFKISEWNRDAAEGDQLDVDDLNPGIKAVYGPLFFKDQRTHAWSQVAAAAIADALNTEIRNRHTPKSPLSALGQRQINRFCSIIARELMS